jgi:hypothetical protein
MIVSDKKSTRALSTSLQAVAGRLRCDRTGHRPVNRVLPNALKGVFHDFSNVQS